MSTVSPVVIASSLKHTATIIFLHGLGDTGNGWSSAIANIRPPYMKVICPTAQTIPVTLNNGFPMPAWFDIRGLDESADEDAEGIANAATLIQGLIEKEIKEGIPSERIVLAGFSQGGALALYSSLTYTKKLAGVIGLSCWLPLYRDFYKNKSKANTNIPVLLCHGDCDPIISHRLGQMSASIIRQQHSTSIEFKTYRGLAHSSSDTELNDMKNFLRTYVPAV